MTTLTHQLAVDCVCGPYLPPGQMEVVSQVVSVASGVLAAVLAVALGTVVVGDAGGWAEPPRRMVAALLWGTLGALLASTMMLLLLALDASVIGAWWFPTLVGSYVVATVMVAATPVLARVARWAAGDVADEPAETTDIADRPAS